MRWASGRKAWGICDRCGLRWKLRQLAYQSVDGVRTKLKVCPDCMDEDNPQGFPSKWLNKTEAISLHEPRPDSSNQGVAISLAGFGPVRGVEIEVWPHVPVSYNAGTASQDNLVLDEDGDTMLIAEDGTIIVT